MTHQEFTPGTRQQNLIDAAQSITAPGQTVAELIREAGGLLYAIEMLFLSGDYSADAAKRLVHMASNNIATVNLMLEGVDVKGLFVPLDQD